MSDGSRRFLFLVLLCWLATTPLNAATLYLPRQFQPSELSTVGIALVNPTTTSASATFRLKSADGATVATAQRAITAKGQVAVTLDQLFPAASSGYVVIDTDSFDVAG